MNRIPLIISEAARGSVRDSMSILEQCISYGNGNLKYSENFSTSRNSR